MDAPGKLFGGRLGAIFGRLEVCQGIGRGLAGYWQGVWQGIGRVLAGVWQGPTGRVQGPGEVPPFKAGQPLGGATTPRLASKVF